MSAESAGFTPAANRKQDQLRDEIKGRRKQTYLNPDRTWIMGNDSRIYYYKYLDAAQRVMVGVSVFELDPKSFALKRQILAQRAYWSSSLNAWVFENGWSSDFRDSRRLQPGDRHAHELARLLALVGVEDRPEHCCQLRLLLAAGVAERPRWT